MIVPVDQKRFAQACRWAEEHATPGVGGLGEKTTHRALKYYFLPRETCHEQKIGGFVADGLGEDGVLEIQSKNLYTLLPKLEAFLPEYPAESPSTRSSSPMILPLSAHQPEQKRRPQQGSDDAHRHL